MYANFFVPVFLKKKAGIRAELDQRDEKLGYKIREAQMKKYRIWRLWEIKSAAIILYM
ncbi:His/Gly/Thr/Pro-type tRNA ligase C-terminal domain-containing protein [Bacillus velezensis]|nr:MULTISPECIES: His/Gly/Thr/Pro-type tRNA ligase C-terminal domain-containing protein [Bacillus]MEC3674350.1 His/Gly/Thr/Pro-type tRNA ligase C-terminal domain-containing protein [Bacillus velezensis]UJA34050.1 His/Gly/Thr/Pro-type tRNA ligase C-terminal domain-containing protein [Bacillus velezensis]UJX16527.1 His/Gly/Thr/Pro-type tRNA ligase C-terminal domain-containing protein [Bacillus sp. R45]WBL37606.1 His/Gly/Thr/Pro-type tRNA ligase C-terminal domain-containing protein [Bacillus veleze